MMHSKCNDNELIKLCRFILIMLYKLWKIITTIRCRVKCNIKGGMISRIIKWEGNWILDRTEMLPLMRNEIKLVSKKRRRDERKGMVKVFRIEK